MKRTIFSLSIFLISLFSFILPFRLESAITPEKYELTSGLKLIYVERHELPIVILTILVEAGSKDEPPELAGLANFTGKMLTEGTERYTSQDISEELEYIGAGLDVEVDYDYTLIRLSILKKDMEKGLDILFDVLENSRFPEKEIQRKRDIIISFIMKSQEDPMNVAIRELRRELFGTHPYGRPVEGFADTVRSIKREDILRFYSENYSPQRAIAVIGGDISKIELKEMIEKYFIKWIPHGDGDKIPISDKFPRAGEKKTSRNEVFIEKDLTQSSIALGVKGLPRNDKDYYSLMVMNYILGGGGFSSRLMQRIREMEGLAYDVSSYHTLNLEPGIFIIQAQTKNESRERVLEIIKEEIKRIRTRGITDKELVEAKSYLKGSFKRRLDTMVKIAEFLSIVEFFGLGDDYITKYSEYIDSVSKNDVRRIASRLFEKDIFTVVVGRR